MMELNNNLEVNVTSMRWPACVERKVQVMQPWAALFVWLEKISEGMRGIF